MKTIYLIADLADCLIDGAIAVAFGRGNNPVRRVMFTLEVGRRECD